MFSNLKGDLFGGLSASIIALPLAIAFGLVAFAPLGPDFASQGALACLYGAILTSFFASLFGGTPVRITGPTGPLSVLISTMIAASLVSHSITEVTSSLDLSPILIPVFFTVLLGGLFQILLGVSGGGRLIKYIPYPVIAGFMNGVALIIFLSQVKPFLGLNSEQSVIDILTGGVTPSWITIIVGTTTILAVLIVPRYLKGVPGALMGLIAGIGCFYILGFLVRPDLLVVEGNPLIIGNIPNAIPKPTMALNFIGFFKELDFSAWMAILIPALTLGMLGSVDSLLTALVADVVTKTRHNSKQELIGQGIANMIAASFGGLPGSGSTVRTLANVQNGGSTRLSGMVCGFFVFLILVLFGKYARFIPYAALAGILMVTSSRMVDTWSFGLIKRRSTLRDMAIVVIVAGTTVVVDLMTAVGIGVLITALLFVKDQITRSVIKTKLFGDLVHSKKVRAVEEMEYLEKHGRRIVVYQLDGTVFFGTADALLKEIEKDTNDVDIIILDFRLVREIDLTGTQIIRQLNDQLHDSGKYLVLSYITPLKDEDQDRISRFLMEVGVLDQIGEDKLFEDTDRALEWAEDYLIRYYGAKASLEARRVDLKKMKIFQYLNEEEIDKISDIVNFCTYDAGNIIFEEGDEGDTMYLVSKGCVSVLLDIGHDKRKKRVASFGEGVFFGDMALLEEKPRSATAVAEEDSELYSLTRTDFFKLLETEPQIASKIQFGIARELSARLRATSDELRVLEM